MMPMGFDGGGVMWLVSQNAQSPAKIVFLRAIVIRTTHTHKTHSPMAIADHQHLPTIAVLHYATA
jgi:hypothetical protein